MKAQRESIAFPRGLVHGTVALNFRKNPPSEFGVYADAFHEAGRTLVQKLAEANGYLDTDACPIIFLYRQALELYIKGTLVSGERLLALEGKALPIDKRLLGSHRLSPLVPGLVSVFRVAGWQWVTDVPHFRSASEFCRYLKALEAVDPLSFAFRYPTDKSGKANLAHHFSFSIVAFAEILDPVLEFLSGGLSGLEDLWQEAAEAAHERQRRT